jgi:predicted PurR-regulated permease PerM
MKKLFRIIQRLAIILLFLILFLYALDNARTLLYPIILAILFSYLLFPVGQWLERQGMSRIPANFTIIIFSAMIIGSMLLVLYSQLGLYIQDLPELRKHAGNNINRISESISSYIGISPEKLRDWVNTELKEFPGEGGFLYNTIFPSTTGTLTAMGLMPVYVFLFLYYRDKLYRFSMMICRPEKRARLGSMIKEISYVTKRYMGGVFTVVLILCFINSIGLLLIGVRYAILLGIISAVCNFVPYFGTLIGALFPLTMAIFTGESPQEAIGVVIMFILVQFTENNILTPNITGGSVQINPMVTILSIIGAGMLWGLPGMFVVVPIMGILKIVLESDEKTKPIAFLLGLHGTEEHSITFRKIKKFFRIGKKRIKNHDNNDNQGASI